MAPKSDAGSNSVGNARKNFEVTGDTRDGVLAQLPTDVSVSSVSTKKKPILLFEGSIDVVDLLREHGFHFGYWRNEAGVDHGLIRILDERDTEKRRSEMEEWIRMIEEEARSFDGAVSLWHPQATEELASMLCNHAIIRIRATELSDALRQWSERKTGA